MIPFILDAYSSLSAKLLTHASDLSWGELGHARVIGVIHEIV